MSRLGFYFDAGRCSGCRACQIACKDRWDNPVHVNFRTVHTLEAGTYPDCQLYNFSQACNHCASPACVANCPTGSMVAADDGTVQFDNETCIGCGTCVESCPYNIPVLVDVEDGKVARKCDSCKAWRDKGENPVCVDACNMRCLDFGDQDELREKYGNDMVADIPFLPSSETTDPSTLIKTKECVLVENPQERII